VPAPGLPAPSSLQPWGWAASRCETRLGSRRGEPGVCGENACQKAALASKVTENAGASGVPRQLRSRAVLGDRRRWRPGFALPQSPCSQGKAHSKPSLVPITAASNGAGDTGLAPLAAVAKQPWERGWGSPRGAGVHQGHLPCHRSAGCRSDSSSGQNSKLQS